MNEIFQHIRQASSDDKPCEKLESLVYSLSSQGFTRQNIYDLFLKFHADFMYSEEWIAIENKFNGDHPVDLILDRLSSWCRKEAILLPD